MRATWYVLDDGTLADPSECTIKDGVLTHKSGGKVAMRSPDCPRSRGVDLDAKGKPLGAKPAETKKPEVREDDKKILDPDGKEPSDAAPKARDMKAEEPKRTYKTRDSKAD